MKTTFQNAEKQRLRRQELDHHLQVIASATTFADADLFNPDLPSLADDLTGQPLTKSTPQSLTHGRCRRARAVKFIVIAICCAVVICVLISMFASNGGDRSPSMMEVDAPTARYRRLFSLILDMQITPRHDLEVKSTPQARALEWLAYKDKSDHFEDVRTRFALATLFFSTQTTTSTWRVKDNWLSLESVCSWYGVECFVTQTNSSLVKALNLSTSGLVGVIPDELSLLQLDCEVLDLSYNEIQGTIPESIGRKMLNLRRLYLGPNKFESTLPESLFSLIGLTHLYIDSCNLHGSLPSEIGNLKNLHGLGLHGNKLSGEIPETLGNLKGLRVLYLDDNRFGGALPRTLGSLSGLVDLRIGQNELSGPVPMEMANLILLEVLCLDNNKLSGSVSDFVAESWPFLTQLHLQNNHLEGRAPGGLARATFLRVVYLDGNNFIGSMPDTICQRRREGVLEELWADCAPPAEIECSLDDCCTRCLVDNP